MLWKNLRERLTRLRELFKKISTTETQELQTALILADVGEKYSRLLTERTAKGKSLDTLKKEITELLTKPKIAISTPPPEIILVVGVNGSGKTTTIAKLAHYFSKQGKSIIAASSDTYRDAASLQLEIWAKKVAIDIVTSQQGQDGASVAFDAIKKAQAKNVDFVIVDSAGRLHTRADLMEELKKIKRVIGKVKSGAPERILLTIDATLGQNSIKQAMVFNEAIGITGLVLTKMDGTAKGGAIIPIVNELNVPIEFIGVGEDVDDLVPFDPKEFVETLFS